MRLNHPELVHEHPAHLVSPVKMWFGTVDPPRTHMKELYTPCYLCHDVVREGSRRFDALEPPRTSVRAHCTPWFFCEDVVREGSVESNHSELM